MLIERLARRLRQLKKKHIIFFVLASIALDIVLILGVMYWFGWV